MSESMSPRDAYKAMIDQLVEETRTLGSGGRVREHGSFSKAPAHREFNRFIESLSEEQREILARMLQEERDGAIHDVLAALSWWIDARGMGFTLNGKPMPVDLSGIGLHGDYVGRCDGWEWPSEKRK